MTIEDPMQESPVQNLNPTASEAPPRKVKGLYNRATPQITRQREKPAHRIMVELAAKGWTPREIAQELGCNFITVHQILNQPYQQENLVSGLHDNFGTDREVVELIKENVIKAIQTTVDILEDESARKSDRLAAANLLLERRYGKANTPINRGTDVDLNNIPDSELAKVLPNN